MTETLQNIALILASVSVIYGVFKWRIEFVGQRRVELAENILALFYEAENALWVVRNKLGYPGEVESREATENESPNEKSIRDGAHVYIERLRKNNELFGNIHALRYRYMALFGKENGKPFDDLDQIINDLVFSAQGWAHYMIELKAMSAGDERFDETQENYKEAERVMRAMAKDDPIAIKIDAVIKEIESKCQPMIQFYNQPTAIPGLSWVRNFWPKK